METEVSERRRLAIVDGERHHDLLVPLDVRLGDALQALGIRPEVGRDVVLERDGREVSPLAPVETLSDGAVLAVVDLSQRVAPRRRGRSPGGERRHAPGAWWSLLAAAVLLSTLSLLVPGALPAPARLAIAGTALGGAALSGAALAAREPEGRAGAHPALIAVLALAFAAGVTAVPELPAATTVVAVFVGLAVTATLAGLLTLVTRVAALRAELTTATTLLLTLAGVWGAALVLHLDAAAAAALTVGLAPVALRVLLATLVDVPPGMFIDYARYQTNRWSVRQRLPEEIHSIAAADAHGLVARSSGRLLAGTFVVCAAAALSAPIALPDFDPADPLVLAGRIALAVTTVLALLLGARRSSSPLLRWMPRAAAGVVLAVAVLAAARDAGHLWTALLAGACLAIGTATAFAVVPAGRGAQSLFWSRLADIGEWIAIALSLPAALLAADAVGVLRGMMNA